MNFKPLYSLPAIGTAALVLAGFIASASPTPSPQSPSASGSRATLTLIPSAQAAPAPPPPAFARCAACHSSTRGAAPIVGPNLFGKFGTRMGNDRFAYSKAVKESGLTLDEATLDKWIENPRALVPGNRMAFPGIKDPVQRKAIIEHLKKLR